MARSSWNLENRVSAWMPGVELDGATGRPLSKGTEHVNLVIPAKAGIQPRTNNGA
jgi:hypothetical protein